MRTVLALSTLVSSTAMMAQQAHSANRIRCQPDSPVEHNIAFKSGGGFTRLSADEIVYINGDRFSHLFWDSQAPIITNSVEIPITEGIKLLGQVKTAFSGNSKMLDFDWDTEGPGFRSFSFDEWTDRSIHTNTDLERYLDLSLSIDRNFQITPCQSFGVEGGLKYTTVQWAAYSGTYIYSMDGFRDITWEGAAPGKGISYAQTLPGIFVGAKWHANVDKWSFTTLGRIGVTLSPRDKDNHWRRKLLFRGEFDSTPFFELQAEISYAVTDRASLYLSASYDKYLHAIGDTTMEDVSTGEVEILPRGAGMSFQTQSISTGFRYQF